MDEAMIWPSGTTSGKNGQLDKKAGQVDKVVNCYYGLGEL